MRDGVNIDVIYCIKSPYIMVRPPACLACHSGGCVYLLAHFTALNMQ